MIQPSPSAMRKKCAGPCKHVKPIIEFDRSLGISKDGDGYKRVCMDCELSEFKTCVGCHSFLPLVNFYDGSDPDDGKYQRCIKCESVRKKRLREAKNDPPVLTFAPEVVIPEPETQVTKPCKGVLCFGKEQPLSAFQRNHFSKDGHLHTCKKCLSWNSMEARGLNKKPPVLSDSPCKSCLGPLHKGSLVPVDDFWKNASRSDGLQSLCKACLRISKNNPHNGEVVTESDPIVPVSEPIPVVVAEKRPRLIRRFLLWALGKVGE